MKRALVGREAAVIAAYRAGQSSRQIADAEGVCHMTVVNMLRRCGEPRRPRWAHRKGAKGYKPRVADALPAAELRHYAKLRQALGAKAAREAFGLPVGHLQDRSAA